jgi:glycosyltransferase involved in cell wall biosynthesis
MRIAIVHPYPAGSRAVGGATRVHELAVFLAPRHEVSLYTHAAREGEPGEDEVLAGAGVTQVSSPRPPAGWTRKLRWWVGPLPYYVHRNANPALAQALAAADAARPFDVVHLELGYMVPLLAGVSPRAVRVVAEQEAMPLALSRLRRLSWRRRSRYELLAALVERKARRFDARTLPRFDRVYGITADEAQYLAGAAGRPVGVLPHVVRVARFAAAARAQAGECVLFVGTCAHRPNVHGLGWFLEPVGPTVRRAAPGAGLEVVGCDIPGNLLAALSRAGACVRGYVPDLPSCYAGAAVVVTPLRSGGGMRGKVLEAFASARALVSTPTGLEGIEAVSGTHCLCAGEAPAFADAVLRYLGDPALRRAHGLAARRLVEERHDVGVVDAGLERDLQELVDSRALPAPLGATA